MKNNWKQYGKIGVAAVLLTVAGLYYGVVGKSDGTVPLGMEKTSIMLETLEAYSEEIELSGLDTDITSAYEAAEETASLQMYYVHVCGEVNCPGVYALPEGSRIFEVVEAAGGLTESASQSGLNQAQKIEDGMQIIVFSREEAENQRKIQEEQESGLININTAPKEQLMTLSGIGEARAEAILQYREESGGFRSVEEIMNVPGIKEAAYKKIKDRITI